MSLFERPVNISINPAAHKVANGLIWSVVDGVVKTVPFLIDRPQLVRRGLNPHTYLRVVKQLVDMGIQPEVIELHADDHKYLYDGKSYKNKIAGIPMSASEMRYRSH